METIEKKIHNLINDSYIIKFKAWADVSEDSFKDGTGNTVNYLDHYKEDENIVSSLSDIQTTIKELFFNYVENECDYYEDLKEEHITIIDDRLCINQLVNNDNYEVSESELKAWKNGGIMLYIQDININISINGINLNDDILRDIFESASF